MSVQPIGTALLASDLCSCGRPIGEHRCPSSQGAAERTPKTASCRACGEKAHQNLEKYTVALECLYRQWAKATGQLAVRGQRLLLPPVTLATIQQMHDWAAQGGAAMQTNDNGATELIPPTTAAVLKRMQARAETAPPLPGETVAAAPDATSDDPAPVDERPAAAPDAPIEVQQQCGVDCHVDEPFGPDDLPEISLDAQLVAATPGAPDDYADLI